jgi:hypothetical protein
MQLLRFCFGDGGQVMTDGRKQERDRKDIFAPLGVELPKTYLRSAGESGRKPECYPAPNGKVLCQHKLLYWL